MKILIKGISGSGKTFFFLPEIIKILNPKRIFKIKTSIDSHGENNSPHWNGVKWEYYNDDIQLTQEDLVFIDEPFYIVNKEDYKIINGHQNVVISVNGYSEMLDWLEDQSSYLIVDSIYIKPNSFSKSLFNCPLKEKIKELKQLIKTRRKV